MPKDMRSNHRNAGLPSQPPEQGVDVGVGQRLTLALSPLLDEEVVGFDLNGVCSSHIGYNLINQVG